MRVISSAGLTAIANDRVSMALLVELQLTEPVLANSSSLDLVIDGRTYLGTHGLGQVGAVEARPGEMPRLQLSMSGVPSDKISLALTEDTYRRDAILSLALFTTAGVLTDVLPLFRGSCDQLTFVNGPDGAVLTVTVESGATNLLRPSGVLYTDAAQRRIDATDRACQYVTPNVEKRIVFPAASFFRK